MLKSCATNFLLNIKLVGTHNKNNTWNIHSLQRNPTLFFLDLSPFNTSVFRKTLGPPLLFGSQSHFTDLFFAKGLGLSFQPTLF